jgi:hypothetical protein
MQTLVDPIYSQFPGRWFARLISINQERILKEGDEKIGRWMLELMRDDISEKEKIENLRKGPLHLRQASVGIITIMLYLRNKTSNSIWFEAQHKGLRILYPEIGEFSPNGQQYACYNTVAKEFARQYSFGDSELDFIFQEIHKL